MQRGAPLGYQLGYPFPWYVRNRHDSVADFISHIKSYPGTIPRNLVDNSN